MRIKLTNLQGEIFYLSVGAIVSITQNIRSTTSTIYIVGGETATCRESPEEVNRLCDEAEIALQAKMR